MGGAMKFSRVQFTQIDGEPKSRYTLEGDERLDPFCIEASRAGVELKNDLAITKNEDMQPFAKAVADAWKDHLKFKPKLSKTLSGH
jgi:hypothetical protein